MGLDDYELDVDPCSFCEGSQVARIRREDVVAVPGETDDCGIDRIGKPTTSQEHARPTAQVLVHRRDIDAGEQPSYLGLPTMATSPHLSDHPAVAYRWSARATLRLDQSNNVAVATFHSEKRPRIQDQAHAAPRPRRRGLVCFGPGSLRTTTARARARRVASRISSSVISP